MSTNKNKLYERNVNMIKKLIATIVLGAALILGGCTSKIEINRTNTYTDDVEKQADGTIIISGNFDEDTFKEFRALTLDGKDHYTVLIMSNGGCAYNTIAIMNWIEILQARGVKFTMIVPGHGFSAGSYMFMMGDERIMYRGSHLMWHTMSGQLKTDGTWWTIPIYRHGYMLGMDKYVVGMFTKRFPHLTDEWVESTFWNSGMTFMSAEQALLMGIATKIIN